MPGDGASIEIGVTKAVTAPFKIAAFFVLGFVILLVGRMAIDLWTLADHPAELVSRKAMVERELKRADEAPDFMGPARDRALYWSSLVMEWMYRKPGLLPDDGAVQGATGKAILRGMRALDFAIYRALAGSQVISIRAAILFAYLPWAGFLYGLAVVDGVVERARRKFGAGRESSTLYHRAKYFQVTCLTVAVAAYLWWPGDIGPWFVVVPTLLTCALLVRLQAKYYKKYI